MAMDLTIEAITAKIAEVAARLPPTGKRIRMEIGLEHPVIYDGRVSPAQVDNQDRDVDATIAMDFDTFVRLSEGKTSGPAAMMTGKLKIKGDMSAAMGFQPLMAKVQQEYRGA